MFRIFLTLTLFTFSFPLLAMPDLDDFPMPVIHPSGGGYPEYADAVEIVPVLTAETLEEWSFAGPSIFFLSVDKAETARAVLAKTQGLKAVWLRIAEIDDADLASLRAEVAQQKKTPSTPVREVEILKSESHCALVKCFEEVQFRSVVDKNDLDKLSSIDRLNYAEGHAYCFAGMVGLKNLSVASKTALYEGFLELSSTHHGIKLDIAKLLRKTLRGYDETLVPTDLKRLVEFYEEFDSATHTKLHELLDSDFQTPSPYLYDLISFLGSLLQPDLLEQYRFERFPHFDQALIMEAFEEKTVDERLAYIRRHQWPLEGPKDIALVPYALYLSLVLPENVPTIKRLGGIHPSLLEAASYCSNPGIACVFTFTHHEHLIAETKEVSSSSTSASPLPGMDDDMFAAPKVRKGVPKEESYWSNFMLLADALGGVAEGVYQRIRTIAQKADGSVDEAVVDVFVDNIDHKELNKALDFAEKELERRKGGHQGDAAYDWHFGGHSEQLEDLLQDFLRDDEDDEEAASTSFMTRLVRAVLDRH